MKESASRWTTILTAVLVTALWGFNFVVIAVGIRDVPPLLLASLRFVLAVFPAIFFVRRPQVSWGLLAAYGIVLGVGQFGLLFTAMKVGAAAGLSSIILQAQAFFTALLAVVFLGEKFRLHNGIGMAAAALGLVLIAWSNTSGVMSMPLIPLFMLLFAALSWAGANVLARKMGRIDTLGLMVWSSLFSPLPLLVLSYFLEGPSQIVTAVEHFSLLSFGALAYLAFLSTLLGYGLWNWLISQKGASTVAPFSLLVPLFGVTSSILFLGEQFTLLHLLASVLILGGLAIHVFGGRLKGKIPEVTEETGPS